MPGQVSFQTEKNEDRWRITVGAGAGGGRTLPHRDPVSIQIRRNANRNAKVDGDKLSYLPVENRRN